MILVLAMLQKKAKKRVQALKASHCSTSLQLPKCLLFFACLGQLHYGLMPLPYPQRIFGNRKENSCLL